jgi:hypothetical protein
LATTAFKEVAKHEVRYNCLAYGTALDVDLNMDLIAIYADSTWDTSCFYIKPSSPSNARQGDWVR